MQNNLKKRLVLITLIFAPLAAVFISLFIGRYPISVGTIIEVLAAKLTGQGGPLEQAMAIKQTVVWDIRLPRAMLAALVGGSLAVSGTAFQGLFRNPLVSSGILGVSSGAGFGAALAILLFNTPLAIYAFAFIFAILAVFFSYLIGSIYKSTPAITLVLGGVIVSSVFSALISLAKYLADPLEKLPTIVFWLMGSLASARYQDLIFGGVPMLLGMAGLTAIRWRINVLSMGERESRALGIDTFVVRGIVIVCATLATAGAVCVSGIIGWIGLVIPHIGRMLVGNDNKALIPASISLGACFLLLVDGIGRIISGGEIPVGIITALVGGPFFVYLLKKTKGGGW